MSIYSPSVNNKGMKGKELPQGIVQELAWDGDSSSPSYGATAYQSLEQCHLG